MITEPRTIIIRDVEFHWAKLDKTVKPFGTERWETQLRTRDEDKAKEMTDMHLTMKKEEDSDGSYWKCNVNRNLYKANQDKVPEHEREKNTPPDVLDGNKQPLEKLVGNGSIGNVKIFQAPYNFSGRKGVSNVLTAVQVIELEKYKPNTGVDFDVVDAPTAESSSEDF